MDLQNFIDNEFVWVDASLKSESIIPIEQFKNNDGELDISIGDHIDVVLEHIDNNMGETRLSREKAKRLENIKINEDFDYTKLHSISAEGREKLKTVKPKTIAQAARISGVSPADINVLLVYLGR